MKETTKLNNLDVIAVNEGESFDSYRLRIYKLKKDGIVNLSWLEVARLFEKTFGIKRDESKWRKEASQILEVNEMLPIDDNKPTIEDLNEFNEELKQTILEYKKEKVKISDERTQNNAYIRRLAREETLIEMARVVAEEMSSYSGCSVYPLCDSGSYSGGANSSTIISSVSTGASCVSVSISASESASSATGFVSSDESSVSSSSKASSTVSSIAGSTSLTSSAS